jgi:uncharacterized YigZ family protein
MQQLQESDFYLTIAEPKIHEIKVEKSRFIGHTFSAKTVEEAQAHLESVRLEHYNANHNCWAFNIGGDGLTYRYSDDGEPHGTAGKHILFEIKSAKLTDIIVIVTRYFGGKKLGKGGLGKAYGSSAKEVINITDTQKVILTVPIEVFCGYEDISVIKRLLSDYALEYDEEYADSIRITAHIPKSYVDSFTAQVTETTAARAGWKYLHPNEIR